MFYLPWLGYPPLFVSALHTVSGYLAVDIPLSIAIFFFIPLLEKYFFFSSNKKQILFN